MAQRRPGWNATLQKTSPRRGPFQCAPSAIGAGEVIRQARPDQYETEVISLHSWTAAVCAEFGIDPAAVDLRKILDLVRDVAQQVERPAAPVTAFLAGLAIGAGVPADEAIGRVLALADGWQPAEP
ncbi:MAG: DUF6457 domain-containing protein [Streptosporangiaceae bacterium]